jgi:hypothetical protein
VPTSPMVMEAAGYSENLVPTRRHMPSHSLLQTLIDSGDIIDTSELVIR